MRHQLLSSIDPNFAGTTYRLPSCFKVLFPAVISLFQFTT